MSVTSRAAKKLNSIHCHRSYHSNRRRSLSEPRHADAPAWPTNPCPSPFEVLGVADGEKNYKASFSKLVKLYHPDLQHHRHSSGLSESTLLQRYHLVVAANELLSDPKRRAAYEAYRSGWIFPYCSPEQTKEAQQQEGVHYSDPYTAAGKQQPIYTSNATFIMLLLAAVLAVSVTHQERIRSHRLVHNSKELAAHRAILWRLIDTAQKNGGRAKEELICDFLVRREIQKNPGDEKWDFLRDLENNTCRH